VEGDTLPWSTSVSPAFLYTVYLQLASQLVVVWDSVWGFCCSQGTFWEAVGLDLQFSIPRP